MIDQNSRYADYSVALLPSLAGDPRLTLLSPPADDVTFRFTYYQWSQDDRVDNVAYDFYGDATQWWVIAEANPEILLWSDVPLGTIIRVPGA